MRDIFRCFDLFACFWSCSAEILLLQFPVYRPALQPVITFMRWYLAADIVLYCISAVHVLSFFTPRGCSSSAAPVHSLSVDKWNRCVTSYRSISLDQCVSHRLLFVFLSLDRPPALAPPQWVYQRSWLLQPRTAALEKFASCLEEGLSSPRTRYTWLNTCMILWKPTISPCIVRWLSGICINLHCSNYFTHQCLIHNSVKIEIRVCVCVCVCVCVDERERERERDRKRKRGGRGREREREGRSLNAVLYVCMRETW